MRLPVPCLVASLLTLAGTANSFAAGGFGGSGGKKQTKSSSDSTQKKKSSQTKINHRANTNLLTPEGRLDYIRSRIQAADLSPLSKLVLNRKEDNDQFVLDIDPNGVAVIDNFLGKDLIQSLRMEAESLLPYMVPSQSTRWDEETKSVIPYEKKGVLSTQIEGGTEGYRRTPRLVEYIVGLTSNLSQKLNQMLPDAYHLSREEQTNKLAVCLGDGSHYDKHIDNLGGTSEHGDDRRKLTALLYLQQPGSHDGQPAFPEESIDDDERGGYFRAYDVPKEGDVTCIAPRGDRLVCFWSDTLVHDVSPSFAPNGDHDRRWALTIWLIADKKTGQIRATDAAVSARHFDYGGSSIATG